MGSKFATQRLHVRYWRIHLLQGWMGPTIGLGLAIKRGPHILPGDISFPGHLRTVRHGQFVGDRGIEMHVLTFAIMFQRVLDIEHVHVFTSLGTIEKNKVNLLFN